MINFDALVPAYNAQSTIKRALNSIDNQSCRPVTVVIIINGCNDQTERIVDDFSMQTSIKVKKIVFKENAGIVGALNGGLKACSSSWVARLDADDYWLEAHLENLKKAIENDKDDLALISGTAIMKDYDRSMSSGGALDCLQLKKALIKDNPIVHSSSAYRLQSVRAVGLYNNDSVFQDYNLWIRLLAKYSGCIIKSDMCVHERNEFSMTANMQWSDSINERFKNQLSAFKCFKVIDVKIICYLIFSFARVLFNFLINFGSSAKQNNKPER